MFASSSQTPEFRKRATEWNEALTAAVSETAPEMREQELSGWRDFPHSYEMHPRGGAEHFMPLLVCAGAGGDGQAGMYKDSFMGWDIWSYYWE